MAALFLALSSPVAANDFSVKEYHEFHRVLHPLEHEALPKNDFATIRARAAELVTLGNVWITTTDLKHATKFVIKPQGVCRYELCFPLPKNRNEAELKERLKEHTDERALADAEFSLAEYLYKEGRAPTQFPTSKRLNACRLITGITNARLGPCQT